MTVLRISVLGLTLAITGCTSSTRYGACVGFGDDNKDPHLIYKVSVRNTMWSFFGIETIIAPVLWATDYVYCPVGRR